MSGLKLVAAALAGAGAAYAYLTSTPSAALKDRPHGAAAAGGGSASAPVSGLHSSSGGPVSAICLLAPDNNSGVSGVVRFRQAAEGEPTSVSATVQGLKDGLHGFHIHEFGNLSQGCATAGGHYNPFNKTHGALEDPERHVGDLGNVVARRGMAEYSAVDSLRLVQLSGPHSVIGRAVVVHADPDDLGKGGFDDSKTTGHAGGRLSDRRQACGVIGIDKA